LAKRQRSGIPVGHHAGQVVGHGAHEARFGFGGAQRFLGLLALGDVEARCPAHGWPLVLVAQRHLVRGQVARARGRGQRFLGNRDFICRRRGQHAQVVGLEGIGLLGRHEIVVGSCRS
jgi:hypothetical protein